MTDNFEQFVRQHGVGLPHTKRQAVDQTERRSGPPRAKKAGEWHARKSVSVSGSTQQFGSMEETGQAQSTFRRPWVSAKDWQRLQRRRLPTEQSLDLHGMRAEQARRAVVDFLYSARDGGETCVSVVHGKGLNSKPGTLTLGRLLYGWLTRIDFVLAFHGRRTADGRCGATDVLLKKKSLR